MKQLLGIFFFLQALCLMSACSGASDDVTDTEGDTLHIGIEEIGGMLRSGESAPKYIAMQDSLVEQMRLGRTKDKAVDILSQSGYFYMRQGDYLKAMEYLHEASDSLSKDTDNKTLLGKIKLPGNLAGLYSRFGLYEDALQQNAKAIEISRKNDNMSMSDLQRMRGCIYSEMSTNNASDRKVLEDSALVCFDKAVAAAHSIPTKDLAEVTRTEFFVTHPEFAPDSINAAIATLSRIADTDRKDATTARAILGKALVDKGGPTIGIALLQKALKKYRNVQDQESEEWTLAMLAESCLKANRFDVLKTIYPQYIAMRDSTDSRNKINAMIGAEYRYRVKEKERELRMMAERQNMTQKTVSYQRLTLILALIIIVPIIIIAAKKIRSSEKEKAEAHERIDSILHHQRELNSRIEALNQEIAHLESQKTIENVAQQLTPSVLRDDDEKKFRQAFATLHPNFLRNLRHNYPELTDNDELVCMLILLRFNSDEIAMSLGISRQSVISVRYRIRKKMKLEKGEDLDKIIMSHS